jgi:transcriptional regulator with XRE-family HTH domain
MAATSGPLIIRCRIALQLTQKEFGDLVGRTKRTIQRWEEAGTALIAPDTEALVRALHAERPDLAEQIAAAGGTSLEQLGLAPAADLRSMATADGIEAIVRAAADAMGVEPKAIRSAVAAAFVRAHELDLAVETVVEKLNGRPPA